MIPPNDAWKQISLLCEEGVCFVVRSGGISSPLIPCLKATQLSKPKYNEVKETGDHLRPVRLCRKREKVIERRDSKHTVNQRDNPADQM